MKPLAASWPIGMIISLTTVSFLLFFLIKILGLSLLLPVNSNGTLDSEDLSSCKNVFVSNMP